MILTSPWFRFSYFSVFRRNVLGVLKDAVTFQKKPWIHINKTSKIDCGRNSILDRWSHYLRWTKPHCSFRRESWVLFFISQRNWGGQIETVMVVWRNLLLLSSSKLCMRYLIWLSFRVVTLGCRISECNADLFPANEADLFRLLLARGENHNGRIAEMCPFDWAGKFCRKSITALLFEDPTMLRSLWLFG